LAVLVTGGAGYIGSHAARALRRHGYEVILYDNLSRGHRSLAAGFELIEGDLADHAALNRALARADAVMHFAAYAYVGESVEHPRRYFQNNAVNGLALLNAVVDAGIRTFIFSSSCAVYGMPDHLPISENQLCLPVNPYGFSKLVVEHALADYASAYGLRYVTFRYFNAAGADESGEIGAIHDPETRLIPLTIDAMAGRSPALQILGEDYATRDGTCIRDYIHVNDLAEAHVLGLKFLERGGESQVFNLGTGKGYSVREIVHVVERVTGGKVPTRMMPRRAGDPPELVADPSRAAQVLGWKAQRSIEQIVETAWKWSKKRYAES